MRGSLCLAALVALSGAWRSVGQEGKAFFRVVSPADTRIVGFGADGVLVWTNDVDVAEGTCTVQRAASLDGTTNWTDFVQHAVTGAVMSLRVFDPSAPSGMALIPAGSFSMGNCIQGEGHSDELPVHTVYVSAFYMDKTLVTKAKWDEVYLWAVASGYSFDLAGSGKAADNPVQSVNWYDCVKWCNARSKKEGRTPCYYTDAGLTKIYKTGSGSYSKVLPVYCKWSAAGYRLPTEAEWEKAARGGLSGRRFPWGDTISHALANYYASSWDWFDTTGYDGYHPVYMDGIQPYTSPVGAFAANGYGLHDMAGNVWEWCWDWYGSYPSESMNNPCGPLSGSARVVRGGRCDRGGPYCRCSSRGYITPEFAFKSMGFRAVLSPNQQ